MERLPGSSPEQKMYPKYVPFEEVAEYSDGRYQFGIRVPSYVKGTLGVDVARLTRICDYANIGNLVVVPAKNQTSNIELTTGSINPDGSTTGFKSVESRPSSNGIVFPRSKRRSVAIKDCKIEIPTQNIITDLSRQTRNGTPQSMEITAWQKVFDNTMRQSLKDLRDKGLYEKASVYDYNAVGMMLSVSVDIVALLTQGKGLSMPVITTFTAVFLALTNFSDWTYVINENLRSENSARYLFTFIQDSKKDRQFVYGRKLSKPGLIGVVKE